MKLDLYLYFKIFIDFIYLPFIKYVFTAFYISLDIDDANKIMLLDQKSSIPITRELLANENCSKNNVYNLLKNCYLKVIIFFI